MHGHQRSGTRSLVSVAALMVLVAIGTSPSVAQSPSVAPARSPGGFLKWSRSDPAPGFDQEPLVDDVVVGTDGRILLLGAVRDGGQVTPAVWGSDDGQAWSRLPGDMPLGSVAISGVATDDGFLIVTSSDAAGQGQLLHSDGHTVAPVATPSGDLIAIRRSPSGLVALEDGDAPTVWMSTDEGANWTPAAIEGAGLVDRIAVNDEGTLVVVGRVDAGEDLVAPTAWSSVDGGASWTASTLPLDPGSWVTGDLASTPVGLIARIVDATTSEVTGVNLLSRDGTSWQPVLETPGWGSVGTADGEALIYGADEWWHSSDGVDWTKEWWPTLAGFDIAASDTLPDGRVVAAGLESGAAPESAAAFVGSPPGQARPTAPTAPESPAP